MRIKIKVLPNPKLTISQRELPSGLKGEWLHWILLLDVGWTKQHRTPAQQFPGAFNSSASTAVPSSTRSSDPRNFVDISFLQSPLHRVSALKNGQYGLKIALVEQIPLLSHCVHCTRQPNKIRLLDSLYGQSDTRTTRPKNSFLDRTDSQVSPLCAVLYDPEKKKLGFFRRNVCLVGFLFLFPVPLFHFDNSSPQTELGGRGGCYDVVYS